MTDKTEYTQYLHDVGLSIIANLDAHDISDFQVVSVLGFALATGLVKEVDLSVPVGEALCETIDNSLDEWRKWQSENL
jgi:hypothetical protein